MAYPGAAANAAGTMRTAPNCRPVIPRKPICSSRVSLSASGRRSSITRRSFPVKLRSASSSKSLKLQGRYRRPSHVHCQSFMFWNSQQDGTIVRQKAEQKPPIQLGNLPQSLELLRNPTGTLGTETKGSPMAANGGGGLTTIRFSTLSLRPISLLNSPIRILLIRNTVRGICIGLSSLLDGWSSR